MTQTATTTPTVGAKLVAYLWSLPRWFGLPAVALMVTLGGLVASTHVYPLVLANIAGALLMAFAHTWNSFQDWASGLDQGPPEERSRPKPYTSGQNLIARGIVSQNETLLVALVYLALSAVVTGYLADATTPWVWLPWAIAVPCAPLYSFGKFWYGCEFFLTLGFGPAAAMLGAASAPGPELWRAALASLPMGILFGYGAEIVDQYLDAAPNVPKGLRNIGAWTWRHQIPLWSPLAMVLGVVIFLHARFTDPGSNIFAFQTLAAIFLLPFILFLSRSMQRGSTKAIMAGLALVFLYGLALVVLQGVYG